MDVQCVKAIMEYRGFAGGSQMTNLKGELMCLFHTEPVYDKDDKNLIVLPRIACAVYPYTGEFEFSYTIPDTFNKLVTDRFGCFDANRHFNLMRKKFEHNVKMLYKALVEENIIAGQKGSFLNQLEQQIDYDAEHDD